MAFKIGDILEFDGNEHTQLKKEQQQLVPVIQIIVNMLK